MLINKCLRLRTHLAAGTEPNKTVKTKHCAAFRSVSSFGLRKRLGRLLQVGRLLEAFTGARRATARLRSQHLAQLLEVDSAW